MKFFAFFIFFIVLVSVEILLYITPMIESSNLDQTIVNIQNFSKVSNNQKLDVNYVDENTTHEIQNEKLNYLKQIADTFNKEPMNTLKKLTSMTRIEKQPTSESFSSKLWDYWVQNYNRFFYPDYLYNHDKKLIQIEMTKIKALKKIKENKSIIANNQSSLNTDLTKICNLQEQNVILKKYLSDNPSKCLNNKRCIASRNNLIKKWQSDYENFSYNYKILKKKWSQFNLDFNLSKLCSK